MKIAMFSLILPTIAYATIALSAIYSPADFYRIQTARASTEYVYAVPTPSPTPTAIPVPTATATPTPVVAETVESVAPVQEVAQAPAVLNDAQIQFLGNCESGMRPETNTGNGFYGAFQFTIGTWNAMGTGYARADLAPLDVQIAAVQKLLSRSSIFTQFPGCAAKMHAQGMI